MTRGEHLFNTGCYVLFIATFAAILKHFMPWIVIPVMIGTMGIIDLVRGLRIKKQEGDWFR
ncbi:MAG TPA: hypothetical protein VMW42_02085 [Desulfatiglandales bacterium]|nr:hypothetical protein [Desulfatiglandales bacterium]